MDKENLKFAQFLEKVAHNKYNVSVNARGIQSIQQTDRNKLRREGEDALFEDLLSIYKDFDVVQTKDGICLIAHNADFEFTFELKASIKSIDYDPYFEADDFAEQRAEKEAAKKAKEAAKKAKAARDEKLRQEYKKRNLVEGLK